ncbi:probable G-protein coupled receptor 139 [Heterodontus francisci]|uniref:probable G-protein coupled receptor 139 n=1 Tax=Heterodontus francisci TaxID=7792 RepID=UPI00355BD670
MSLLQSRNVSGNFTRLNNGVIPSLLQLTVLRTTANLLTIVILSRGNCGLSKCISVYMVAMATADLLVMLFNIIGVNILSKRFPHSFLSYTAVCKFMIYMLCTNHGMSMWFTVSFTFDRLVAICCQQLKRKYCTVRTAAAVLTTLSILIYSQTIPFWFVYEHKQIINNIHWFIRPSVAFISSPAGAAYLLLQNIIYTWLPFALILLLNVLTVRRILITSRARRGLRTHSSESPRDQEMENRKKSIILLFTVSASFILLNLPSAVSHATSSIAVHYRPDYTSPAYIATQTGVMLQYLSSCTNTCIYAAAQTKFREELKKVMKSPWTLAVRLFSK